MLIFFVIVISYCSANLYFFYKVTTLFNVGPGFKILTGIAVFVMTLMPVFIPIYSHRASERSMKIISYTGYLWLAFLIPYFPAALILDLVTIVSPWNSWIAEHVHIAFAVPLSIAGLIVVYGFFEARNLKIERLVIRTSKLPAGTDCVRIAQISDLHLSVTVGKTIINKIIRATEKESPDIIVSTGDLIDGIVKHVGHLSARLRLLNARYGKFAVTGNHEFYGGLRHTVKFIEDSGFTVLRDSGVTVENVINVAGMDFTGGETRGYSNDAARRDERDVLSELRPGLFTLLLKHRSDVIEECLGLFDLQLSGHSHKGQIFPVNLATMFMFSYHTGFTKLPKGSAIYTSRGTGTAGPPIRFLSAPEITIIDVVKEL
ncbi:MAG: metallophosphoesterase [Nitrospirota bacterium]